MAQGGYRCTFVEEPPPLFICSSCSLVLREPQLTKCCGRNACLSCIGNGSSCSLCRGRLSSVLNRHLKNEILSLQVYCNFKDRGCGWKGKLEVYEKHQKTCEYIDIDCQYGCGAGVQKQYYADHLTRCERYPVFCTNCEENIERRFYTMHIQKECLLQKVECPFSHVGCVAQMLRKDCDAHLNAMFHSHLDLVKRKGEEMHSEWRKTRETLLAEEEREFKKRENEIAMLNETLKETEGKAETLRKLLEKAEQEIKDLRDEQARSKDAFEAEVGAKTAEIQMQKDGIAHLQDQAKIKCYGPPVPKYVEIISRPLPPTMDMYTPPVSMLIDNFNERKFNNEMWVSPPFFTHRRGYKMCLIVYPNGAASGFNKWVSIYVSLIKGEYDSSLGWPFSGKVTVEVRNQNRNVFHERKVFALDNSNDAECDTRKRVYNGYISDQRMGHEKFIAHHLLYPHSLFPDRRYLINNCLLLQVAKVKLD